MKRNRGVLTTEVQELATSLLGRETSVRELRLMPYFILHTLRYGWCYYS